MYNERVKSLLQMLLGFVMTAGSFIFMVKFHAGLGEKTIATLGIVPFFYGLIGVIFGARKNEVLGNINSNVVKWSSGWRMLIFLPVLLIIIYLIIWLIIAIFSL